jgi:Flp pilus assembly protein TadB
MRTLLLAVCGIGIGTGLALAYTVRHPTPPNSAKAASRSPLPARRVLIALLGAGIVYLLTHWIAAIPITLAAVWFLPGMLGRDTRHEHELAVVEAIATFTEMLRDTLSAAAGLNQALSVTCRHAPAPLQPAAIQLAEQLETREATARQALHAFADQIDDPTADLVALALAAAEEHPTRDLAGLLSSLAANAREQAAMRTRTAVAQARTRTAIRMITAITVGLAGILLVIDRSYLAAYDSATGQVVLLWVAGLFALALRWLKSLAVIPPDSRLFMVTEASSGANRSTGRRG